LGEKLLQRPSKRGKSEEIEGGRGEEEYIQEKKREKRIVTLLQGSLEGGGGGVPNHGRGARCARENGKGKENFKKRRKADSSLMTQKGFGPW